MAENIRLTGAERKFLMEATDPKSGRFAAPSKILTSLGRKGVLKHRIDLTPLGQMITAQLREKLPASEISQQDLSPSLPAAIGCIAPHPE